MVYKKFAIVGTLCTGKTTVANLLREKYKTEDIVFVSEAARDFISKYGKGDRSSVTVQGKIQDIILKKEKEAHSQNPKVIVCDRSVIDPVVYLRFYGDKNGSDKLLKKIKKFLLTYDKFLLFSPQGFSFANDGLRIENERIRSKIHKEYIGFFNDTDLPMEIVSGNIDQRLKKAEKTLISFL